MRIGLNATCFNDRPSGASQRFAGIYGALIARCPDIEFIIYEPRDCRVSEWFGGALNVRAVPTPLPSTGRVGRALAGIGFWNKRLQQDGLDVFEQFHLPLVGNPSCPVVLTIHDARPILAEVPWVKRKLYTRILRSALRRADRVLTVSLTIRGDLLAVEPKASVEVVYNGIDPAAFAPDPDPAAAESTRERLRVPDNFILAVGHLEPRKNYLRLIEAVAHLRASNVDASNVEVGLVIVGNDGGEGERIGEFVGRLGLAEQVRLLQGVSHSDLADLYALASLVVFPSTYEGFGIPILEAMAARRPLVLSDIPVFRELTEGRGAYFAPEEPGSIADTIRSVLTQPQRQKALIDYGERRMHDFTFPALARQLEQVYRTLAAKAAERSRLG